MLAHAVVRRRLEASGFYLDDAALAELRTWFRWSPALCALSMGAGTILASPAVLWSLAAIALLGTVFPVHPFDVVYNRAVRRLTGTRPLPPNAVQRRFACGLATAWLVGTGLAFHAGADAIGYALGGVLTAVAAILATTYFCIPSVVYNKLFRPQTATTAPMGRGA